MKILISLLFFIPTIHYSYSNYVNQQYNTAKAVAYFDSDYHLSHYGFMTYDKKSGKKRKIREEHLSPEGEYLSYTLFKYNKRGLLVKEETYNKYKQLIKVKENKYTVTKILTQSHFEDSDDQFTIKYSRGFRNGRLLYLEEQWYKDYDLHHIIRTTYNLQSKPGKIEYFEPEEKDFSDEAKLKWSESIYYNSIGKVDYIIRVDKNQIARNLIRFRYSRDHKLRLILIYEGYVQFKHKKFDYKDNFKLIQKARLIYKLSGKLASLRDRTYRKPSKEAVEIEVVFYDLPEETAELPRPEVEETLTLKEPIKKIDPVTGKIVVVKNRNLDSWALLIDRAATSNMLFTNEDNLLLPLENNELISVNANGKLKWSQKTDGKIIIGPQEYEGIYYLGTNKGSLYAINQGDGSIIWYRKKMGAFKKGSKLHLTEKLIIYISNKKWLRAVNRNNANKTIWSFEGDKEFSTYPVGNSQFTFIAENKTLYCLNNKDGDDEWDKDFNDKISFSPIAFGKNIIVFTEYDITAINIKDEDQRWKLKGIGIITSPFLFGDSLYLGTDEGRLIRVNAINGTLDWDKNINKVDYFISGNGYHLFLSIQDDYFIVIDYRTGDEKSRYEGKRSDTIISPIIPDINGKAVYYLSKSNTLYKDTLK